MREQIADILIEKKLMLADQVTRRFFEAHPDLMRKWAGPGVKRCREDSAFHFAYLAEAVRFDFPVLFTEYIAWAKSLLCALKIEEGHLAANLEFALAALGDLAPECLDLSEPVLREALGRLPEMPCEPQTFLQPEAPRNELASKWLEYLLAHKPREARQLIFDAVKSGVPVVEIYHHVFARALHEVGRLWQMRKIDESEEHYCSQLTQNLLAVLSAEIEPQRQRKTAVGFCVGSEHHEIGIRLVSDCFALHGWSAVCLGGNVPTRNIPGILRNWMPDVVALSTTMVFNLGELQRAIATIRATEMDPRPAIIVGGRPFNICPGLAQRIGADASAQSCAELITCALEAAARNGAEPQLN